MPQGARVETTARTSQPSSFISLLSGWIQQGMESFFATQKILMDVATRQNSNAVKAIKDSLTDPKHSPAAILKELVVEGTSNFIEAQRILLDLGKRENEILLGGVKERVEGNTAATAMTDIVRRSIDTFLELQQEFLTIANRQAEAIMRGPGKGGDEGHLFILARQGMEKFVHAQKEFLDVIAEETEKMTNGKSRRTHKEIEPTKITKLAHESTIAMIDAQKKLLDVAAQQMNVNLQLAGRAGDLVAPLRVPIGKLAGEGVRNFVTAERAMFDNIAKGRHVPPTPEKIKKTVSRAKRRTKARAAAATA